MIDLDDFPFDKIIEDLSDSFDDFEQSITKIMTMELSDVQFFDESHRDYVFDILVTFKKLKIEAFCVDFHIEHDDRNMKFYWGIHRSGASVHMDFCANGVLKTKYVKMNDNWILRHSDKYEKNDEMWHKGYYDTY